MKTALITGASNGIGHALAQCLASHGYNLVIIGRNVEALQNLAKDCSQVKVTILPKDLSQPGAAHSIFDDLAKENIKIDVLVNNAGFGIWGEFAKTDLQLEHQMIELHITLTLDLIKLAIPQMIENGGGNILNIGSVYSFTPVPIQSVYAATKAFMLSFSQSLNEELKQFRIYVTLLCPGATATLFRSRAGLEENKSWINMDAKSVAEIAYKAMIKKKFLIIPGKMNKLYVTAAKFFPVALSAKIVYWLIYSLRNLKINQKDLH